MITTTIGDDDDDDDDDDERRDHRKDNPLHPPEGKQNTINDFC